MDQPLLYSPAVVGGQLGSRGVRRFRQVLTSSSGVSTCRHDGLAIFSERTHVLGDHMAPAASSTTCWSLGRGATSPQLPRAHSPSRDMVPTGQDPFCGAEKDEGLDSVIMTIFMLFSPSLFQECR